MLSDRARAGVDSAIYEAVRQRDGIADHRVQQDDFIRERTGAILPNVAPSKCLSDEGREIGPDRSPLGYGVLAPSRVWTEELASDDATPRIPPAGKHRSSIEVI